MFDAFTVLERMHLSRVTLLYRVRDTRVAGARELAMNALTREAQADAHERLAFAHERWPNKRVVARFFAQNVDPPENASASYSLTTFHPGKTLAQQLGAGGHFSIPEAIKCAVELSRAVGALHLRSIIHRDIKPENIHLGDDEQLRVLDLGVAVSGFEVTELSNATRAGTPSYLAPELFQNGEPSAQSDIYAVAVTLYHLLSRKFPYGEVEPFRRQNLVTPHRSRAGRPIAQTGSKTSFRAVFSVHLRSDLKQQRSWCWPLSEALCPRRHRGKRHCDNRSPRATGCALGR